jgi:hypothetical protein
MAEPPVTPRMLTPWPYTEAELRNIRDSLPADGADDVILAASFFIGDRGPPQPNPYHELLQALHASEELTLAVRSLSPEALARLQAACLEALARLPAHPWPGTRQPSHPYDFGGVLPRFEHDCRLALQGLERVTNGAPVKRDEEAYVYRLWTAWRSAHAMEPPARGWPAFRSACVEPLMAHRFAKQVRPSAREARGWQSLLERARARFEGAKK